MAGAELRRIRLWQDRIETEVEIAGRGPALVYFGGEAVELGRPGGVRRLGAGRARGA